jgi:hypothetical protein
MYDMLATALGVFSTMTLSGPYLRGAEDAAAPGPQK